MKSIVEILAENIRRQKALCLTQEEFDSAIGYSVKTVSKWENGRGVPPTEILPDRSGVLGDSVDFFARKNAYTILQFPQSFDCPFHALKKSVK